ncbi:unnamed protein product, partial [marine sediment metagenome]
MHHSQPEGDGKAYGHRDECAVMERLWWTGLVVGMVLSVAVCAPHLLGGAGDTAQGSPG